MKAIHEKDKRIDRNLFFEAQSICQYTSGGDLLNYKSSAKKRVEEFKKAIYQPLKPQFINGDN